MSNNTSSNSTNTAYVGYFKSEIDIPVGIIYLVLGIAGIVSNGVIMKTFLDIRRTLKMLPFLVCAVCLAFNDFTMSLFSYTPYAILLLLGRPEGVNIYVCSVIGFMHNLCERFAWFIITSIMVFRCASLVCPMKCRNIGPRPFLILLYLLALFLVFTSALPFMPLSFITKRYNYVQNLGDCSFQMSPDATGMVVLTDVIWWGPFLTCVASCAIFVTVMATNAMNLQGHVTGYSQDVIKKTVLLTAFFIVCYLPKSLQSLAYFLAGNKILFTWGDIQANPGYPFVIYYHLVAGYMIPALRCAVTPLILNLRAYMERCNTSKRVSTSVIGTAGNFVKSRLGSLRRDSVKGKIRPSSMAVETVSTVAAAEQNKGASELEQLV